MNKKTRIFWLIKILLLLGVLAVGWYFYGKLPVQIPLHWDIHGVANRYGDKLNTILGLPVMMLVLMVLFYFLPKWDPRRKNYSSFAVAWEVLQLIILGFFAYMYVVILSVSLHPLIGIMPFMFGGLGVLFISLGAAMRHLKSNYFVGIKTPWTLESDVVWDKTHRVGSWTFMVAGILFLLGIFLPIDSASGFIIPIVLCFLIPVVYSYIAYKQLKLPK